LLIVIGDVIAWSATVSVEHVDHVPRHKSRDLYFKAMVPLIPSSYDEFRYPLIEADISDIPTMRSDAISQEVLADGVCNFKIQSEDLCY